MFEHIFVLRSEKEHSCSAIVFEQAPIYGENLAKSDPASSGQIIIIPGPNYKSNVILSRNYNYKSNRAENLIDSNLDKLLD